jgi:hypothetical protein
MKLLAVGLSSVPYGVETITDQNAMSTKYLGETPRSQPNLSGRSPRQLVGAERAAWLINVHYTQTYGHFIQYETPRTMRPRIDELTLRLRDLERGGMAYVMLARTIRDFERISELLEMMPQR